MATFPYTNARLFVNEFDFSGQFNVGKLDYTAEMLDATAFQVAVAGTRLSRAGLWKAVINHEGFVDFDDDGIEEILFNTVGVANTLHTLIPFPTGTAGVIADGDKAYIGKFTTATHSWGGQVGEMFKFKWNAESDFQLGLGRVSIDDATAVAGVVDGSAHQLGDAIAFPGIGGPVDVPSGDRVVALVHIIADDFDNLDIILESDTVANFGGTPSTIATQANSTGVTSFMLETDGSTAISDDYFRLRVTGFTGATATVLGSIAVLRGR